MAESQSANNSTGTRDDLLQRNVESLFSLMRQIHRGAWLEEFGLSPSQARLLFVIARSRDAGVSVTELAHVTRVTPGAITQTADSLLAKGLVTREEDPDDRRVVRLKLTPEACGRMKHLKHHFLSAMSGPFDALTTDELRQLDELLTKIGASAGHSHEHQH